MELMARRLIRDVPDFPKAGILFKDITPVVQDAQAFRQVIDRMKVYGEARTPDAVIGIESRGFIFGAPLALALACAFVPVRKLGKLPGETIREEYALEDGSNTVEMQKDAITPGDRVLLVDDLLATGGTAAAAGRMVERLGGEIVGCVFLVELTFLSGREALAGYDVSCLIEY
jgi:adenine phosphoribosyltransferase